MALAKEKKLDIIGVVETWLRPGQRPMDEPGYQWWGIQEHHSKCPSWEGGVGAWVEEGLWPWTERLEDDSDARMMWMRTKRRQGTSDLYIGICYGHCEGQDKQKVEKWMARLEGKIKKFKARGDVMIVGDFNARVGKSLGPNGEDKEMENGKRLIRMVDRQQLEAANSWKKCKGKWTRERGQARSVLDYIMVEKEWKRNVKKIVVEEERDIMSDHRLLWCEVASEARTRGKRKKQRTDWNIAELIKHPEEYQKAIGKKFAGWEATVARWEQRAEAEGKQEAAQGLYNQWTERLVECLERGVKRKRISDNAKGYWTKELSEKRERKNATYRARQEGQQLGEDDRAEKEQERKKAASDYKKAVRKAKAEFESKAANKLHEARKKEPKKYWKEVRQWKGLRSTLPPTVWWEKEQRETQDKEETKTAWKEAFEKLGVPTESEKYNTMWKKDVEEAVRKYSKERLEQAELDTPPQLNEVAQVLKELENGKAAGMDGIRPEMLRYGGKRLAQVLTLLFQFLWKLEYMPQEWKQGGIFPIYKKGGAEDPNNYRGITLLSVVAKVWDRIINTRLTKWGEKRGLLRDEQGGFREERGCVDLIFMLAEVLDARKEANASTFLCFIDVKKAYDTVWQDGLWWKLWQGGITGKVWRLLREWYKDMSSAVLVDGERTEMMSIGQGVKQGAISSPLLYSLFVNDAASMLEEMEVGLRYEGRWMGLMLYADDMVLLARSGDELQRMIDLMVEFSHRWRFEMHAGKSEVMIVNEPPRGRQWRLDGANMKTVAEFKYLGVEIQRNGRWDAVYKRLLQRAKHRADILMGMGMRAHAYSVETSNNLWHALVAPLLEYGTEVSDPGAIRGRAIEIEQKRAAKAILGCSTRMPDEVARGELGWLSMGARRAIARLRLYRHLVTMQPRRIVAHVFKRGHARVQAGGGARSWCGITRETLEAHGLAKWWQAERWKDFPSKGKWKSLVHGAVQAAEEKRWKEAMAGKETLTWYADHKRALRLEEYLKGRTWDTNGTAFKTQLRGGTHELRVSADRRRHPRNERHERTCEACHSGEVEDETHFLTQCTALRKERARMWRRIDNVLARKGLPVRGSSLGAAERVTLLLGGEVTGVPCTLAVDPIARAGLWDMMRRRTRVLAGDDYRALRRTETSSGSDL